MTSRNPERTPLPVPREQRSGVHDAFTWSTGTLILAATAVLASTIPGSLFSWISAVAAVFTAVCVVGLIRTLRTSRVSAADVAGTIKRNGNVAGLYLACGILIGAVFAHMVLRW